MNTHTKGPGHRQADAPRRQYAAVLVWGLLVVVSSSAGAAEPVAG